VGTISEARLSRRTFAVLTGILVAAFAATLWMASSARAAELVYWDNYSGTPDSVGFANLDGSGGGALNLAGVSEFKSPEGMAYDPVTNRLFAANEGGPGEGQITAINLDGSGAGSFTAPGAPIEEPEGVAIDPVTRTIYWLNTEATPESVSWARLDGSAGGVLSTSGATLEGAYRIAVDPVGGRVYWGNNLIGEATVSFANVDNSGGGNLDISGATTPEAIDGIAVDPAGGRVYWVGNTTSELSFASLSGGGGGDVNPTGAAFNSPYGLALDPSIGRLYWGNYSNAAERVGAIGFANVDGSSGGGIDIATAPVEGPQDPVIIKSPSGTEAPVATRSASSRSTLSCSTGGWSADYPGSFVYQSPRSFAYQWTRDGSAIAGATATEYSAKSAGSYACTVTATNQAGSATQSSAAANVKAAKIKLTTKRKAKVKAGKLAKFKVKGVNRGDVQSGKARVCVKLPKKAKKALKAPKCKTLGKLKGGAKKSVTLKLKVGGSAHGTYKATFVVKGSAGKSAKAKVIVR
jgi:hypothetical protein